MGCKPSKSSTMGIDYYYTLGSAPCRSVLMTAKNIGVELNLKDTNLMAGDNKTPEFLKMNPRHTVPVLNDNGFVVTESRAIISYLMNRYAPNSTLYPTDPKIRAKVDEYLYFDMGTLYHSFAEYYYPVLFAGAPYNAANKTKIDDAFGFLNTFLEGKTYLAGNTLTIADLSLVSTVSTFDVMKYDITAYPNVQKWYQNVAKTAKGYEETNGAGMRAFKELADHCLKK